MSKRTTKPISIEALQKALAEHISIKSAATELGLKYHYASITCTTLGLKATGLKKVAPTPKKSDIPQQKVERAIQFMRDGLTLDETSIRVKIPYLRLRRHMKQGGLPVSPREVRAMDFKRESAESRGLTQ